MNQTKLLLGSARNTEVPTPALYKVITNEIK